MVVAEEAPTHAFGGVRGKVRLVGRGKRRPWTVCGRCFSQPVVLRILLIQSYGVALESQPRWGGTFLPAFPFHSLALCTLTSASGRCEPARPHTHARTHAHTRASDLRSGCSEPLPHKPVSLPSLPPRLELLLEIYLQNPETLQTWN